MSVTERQLNFTFIDNHGNIHYQTTLENVMNPELISGVVLKGLGISPRVAGLVIFVPTVAIAVAIIAFLSVDYWRKSDIRDQERIERPAPSREKVSALRDVESAMDNSARWSNLDVSTDRLAPSRHGE